MEKILEHLTYFDSGVDTEGGNIALKRLLKWVSKTWEFQNTKLDTKYFANIIDIGFNTGVALTTDGVGTKILVAQMMNKYDTIGIDCVAMNVNDVICVGAKPIAMLDYLAVQETNPELFEDIGKGLYEGAKLANISIPGGETAQIKEMISGYRPRYGFDLAGACFGIVPLDKLVIGEDIKENDIIIGLKSSGIHSNGLSLARRIFFKDYKYDVDKYFPELGRLIGEELLEPTHIYVPEIMEILDNGINVKALVNITSDGYLNLTRVKSNVGFIVEKLPEEPRIFDLIQRLGGVSDEEMYQTYNMGIGFCLITPENEYRSVENICKKNNIESVVIGYTVKDYEKKVYVEPKRLIGKDLKFRKY